MLRPAGFSSGTGVGTRGGWAAGRGRVYWGVLRSDYACRAVLLGCLALVCVCRYVCFAFDLACYTFLLERFAFGSRLSLFLCQEKRNGLRCVAFLFRRGSGSPLVRSRMSCGYRALLGSLLACAFLCGDPDGGRRDAEKRSRRRGVGTFLRKHIDLVMFSAGSTLGLRVPNLRQRVFDSLDSLHLIRGKVHFCAIILALPCFRGARTRFAELFSIDFILPERQKRAKGV